MRYCHISPTCFCSSYIRATRAPIQCACRNKLFLLGGFMRVCMTISLFQSSKRGSIGAYLSLAWGSWFLVGTGFGWLTKQSTQEGETASRSCSIAVENALQKSRLVIVFKEQINCSTDSGREDSSFLKSIKRHSHNESWYELRVEQKML